MSVSEAVAARPRRRVKIRAGNLGWFLCWAVIFADIGTSIYYVPGILYPAFGTRSALFVAMTLVLFILLSLKYAEVAWRFPEGGGVVNVASRALHPFVGLLGGMFILVDYYLTAAISALSGMIYLSVVAPDMGPLVVPLTLVALAALGVLNLMGIKDSARASAAVAVVAAIGQVLVVLVTAASLGPAGIATSVREVAHGPPITPVYLVTGFAFAVLAFSGLETVAQLAPAMREPRRRIAHQAMAAVILTMAVTSPLLTLWSTTLLDGRVDPNQFISLLGAHFAGRALGAYVAVSGALLLVFASNTAIIGAYHVFIALSHMGFLPRAIERRNRWRRTPQWAILLAVSIPLLVVTVSRGNVGLLGDVYAFGLLGAFLLTCLSLDIIRWHELAEGQDRGRTATLALGLLTTALVAVAWLTNLVAKPLATEFGGGLSLLGLVVGLVTYARRRPLVFPFMHRHQVPVLPIAMARRLPPADVMAILPRDLDEAEAVVGAAVDAARGRPIVFLYRGDRPARPAELLEVDEPYFRDRDAQSAFALAERAARRLRDRRYVYVPGDQRREVIGDVWRRVRPRETVLADGDQDLLPPLAVDRVRRQHVDGLHVLRLLTADQASPLRHE